MELVQQALPICWLPMLRLKCYLAADVHHVVMPNYHHPACTEHVQAFSLSLFPTQHNHYLHSICTVLGITRHLEMS